MGAKGRRRRLVVWLGVVLVLAGAAAARALTGSPAHNPFKGPGRAHAAADGDEPVGPPPVKTVRPRRDPSLRLTVDQLSASVEPYFRADLRARVSGLVR